MNFLRKKNKISDVKGVNIVRPELYGNLKRNPFKKRKKEKNERKISIKK